MSEQSPMNFYFDDHHGEGLSRESSHPNFVAHFTDDFFYDCTDEFSPFGNDEGSDMLSFLESWYRKNGGLTESAAFLADQLEEWTEKEEYLSVTGPEEVLAIHEDDEYFFYALDRGLIATALGQYKIEGNIHPELRDFALNAIERQEIIALAADGKGLDAIPGIVEQEDSASTNWVDQWVKRLETMKSGLNRL